MNLIDLLDEKKINFKFNISNRSEFGDVSLINVQEEECFIEYCDKIERKTIFLNLFLNLETFDKLIHDFEFISFEKLNFYIEYGSVNPTGFIHSGHRRNLALGGTLSKILTFCKAFVFEEYFVNDSGGQLDNLLNSETEEYLSTKQSLPEHILYNDQSDKQKEVVNFIIENTKQQLAQEGYNFNFVYETQMQKEYNCLDKHVISMSEDGRKIFNFKNNVKYLQKKNLEWTYFASDIFYLNYKQELNKKYNFKRMFMLFGLEQKDHAEPIIEIANSLNLNLKIFYYQLVSFEGKEFSKRNSVTQDYNYFTKNLNLFNYFLLSFRNTFHIDITLNRIKEYENYCLKIKKHHYDNYKSVILGLYKLNQLIASIIDRPGNVHSISILCIELMNFPTEHFIFRKLQNFIIFCFNECYN